jgi:hypothetical protein
MMNLDNLIDIDEKSPKLHYTQMNILNTIVSFFVLFLNYFAKRYLKTTDE